MSLYRTRLRPGAYGQYRGGITGLLRKGIGKVAGVASQFVPGPAGALARKVASAYSKPKGTAVAVRPGAGPISITPMFPNPVDLIKGLQPGMATVPGRTATGRKKPRMNPTNPRALKRAIRRVHRFQDIARQVGFSRAPKSMKGITSKKGRR